MFLRSAEKARAVTTMLQRIADVGEDVGERDRRIAAAWTIGASAQELHDATGIPGAELKSILQSQGMDTSRRARGWRRR